MKCRRGHQTPATREAPIRFCDEMTMNDLADLELPDSSGTLHRLGDLWSETPHVLLFLRHFG